MATDKKALNPVWATAKPFFNGGLSGMMATCIIQPVDMVKVRLQLGDTGGPLGVAAKMVRTQGFKSLYSGLSAGLVRQATYTTARLGLYNNIYESAVKYNEGPLPLWAKAACGLSAGGMGALVGSPADLTLIRMQADTTLPIEQRRNYRGVGDAFIRIVKEEGVAGLFTGAGPTVVRAMALNMGMLASNDHAKEVLIEAGFAPGSVAVVVGSSTIAGFFASVCSLPFDYVKTQLQKQKPDPKTGELPFSGAVDCAIKTFKSGGPLKFYTGFPTYFIRIAPHVVLTLSFLSSLPKIEALIGL